MQLPGVDDPERVRRLIKNTAFLEFRITAYPEAGGDGVSSREDIVNHYGGQLPPDVEVLSRDLRNERGRRDRPDPSTRSRRPVR